MCSQLVFSINPSLQLIGVFALQEQGINFLLPEKRIAVIVDMNWSGLRAARRFRREDCSHVVLHKYITAVLSPSDL